MLRKEKYHVCLVGALAQIADSHVNGISSIPQFTLHAVCDIDGEKLKKRYPQLPDSALYTDYLQAVSSEDIDIVVIAAPNKLHTQIAIEALKAGKCVLCEKPMTHSLESAKQLYEEIKKSPGLFVVSYHFWFKPEVQKFLEERDKFGTIKSFQFISSEELEVEKGWILDQTQGGPWLDWAANALSVLRPVLCGAEVFQSFTVMDVRYIFSKKYEIELKADIDIKFEGIDGNISVDWLSPKGGFIAKTVLRNDRDDEIVLDHAQGQLIINSQLYWSGEDLRYLDVYEDFYNRFNNNRTNIGTGMQDAEIIQAVRNYKGWTAETISLV